MKSMYFTVLCLIALQLGCLYNLKAQDTLVYKSSKKKNFIYFSPTGLCDFVNPSLQFGYERMVFSKLSFQTDAGIIIPHSLTGYFGKYFQKFLIEPNQNNTRKHPYTINTYSGIKLRAQIKYWLKAHSKKDELIPFIAIEGFYTQNNYDKIGNFKITDSTYHYSDDADVSVNKKLYVESFQVEKLKYGINILFGVQFPYRNFISTIFTGPGIVHRIVLHKNRENLNDQPYGEFDGNANFDRQGDEWLLNAVANFNIGWQF